MKALGAVALWSGSTILIAAGLVAYLGGPLAQTWASLWFLAAMIVLGVCGYALAMGILLKHY